MARKSPDTSATLYKVGTKKKGNDENIWIVIELANGIKRWKLFKKPTKKSDKITTDKTTSKTDKTPSKSDKTQSKTDKTTSKSDKTQSKSDKTPSKSKKTDILTNYKMTQLGLLFLDFIEDDSLLPNSPEDVANLDKDIAHLWQVLKKHNFVKTVPKTKYQTETYYLHSEHFTYLVNTAFEINGEGKYFYEPGKITDQGKKLIIQELIKMKFIE